MSIVAVCVHNITNMSFIRNAWSSKSRKKKNERRVDELLKEKENLTTEVWKLQQELSGARQETSVDPGTANSKHLEDFNPNNPYALQRKIEEQESQIQDLHEANETAVSELNEVNKSNKSLTEENQSLTTANKLAVDDVKAENQALRDQLSTLTEQQTTKSAMTEGVEELRREIQYMRGDMKALREQNYTLNEENITLRDDLKDIRRRYTNMNGGINPPGKSFETGQGMNADLSERAERYRREKDAAIDEINLLKSELNQSKNIKFEHTPQVNRSPYSEGDFGKYYTSPNDHTKYSSPTKSNGSYHEYLPRRREPSPTPSDGSDSTNILITGYHSAAPRFNIERSIISDVTSLPPHRDRSIISDVPSVMWERPQGPSNPKYLEDDFTTTSDTDTEVDYKLPPQQHLTHHYQDSTLEAADDLLFTAASLRPAQAAHSVSTASSMSSIVSESDLAQYKYTQRVPASVQVNGLSNHRSLSPTSPRNTSPRAPSSPSGFRSVSPNPLITQHNKSTAMGIMRTALNVQGKRPFAPRSPADINIGDVIKFTRQGGKISRGLVKYVGHLPGRHDVYLGMELEYEEGKHDGVFNNERYFKCKTKKGCFVAFNKVIMVWGT